MLSAMMWKKFSIQVSTYCTVLRVACEVAGFVGRRTHWDIDDVSMRARETSAPDFGRESVSSVPIASDRQTSTKTEFENKLSEMRKMMCHDEDPE
jgi:hypothetical protein